MFSLTEEEKIIIDWKDERDLLVDFSFDSVLSAMKTWSDPRLSQWAKIEIMFSHLINEDSEAFSLEEKEEIISKAIKLLFPKEEESVIYDRRGEPMPKPNHHGKGDGNKEKSKDQFSFTHDAEYIYSSFLQAYGIDLHNELGRLSWRKFQILLRDLPAETKFKKVLEIREWKPQKGDSSERKKEMKKLQKSYTLPKNGGVW